MKVLHSICTIFAPMKARNILILILGTLILPIYLTSCGVDRWKEYAGQTQTDRWIDDTMRVWYYWVDAIPHTNDLNYFQAPFPFSKPMLKSERAKWLSSYLYERFSVSIIFIKSPPFLKISQSLL